jgi:hypothetical protein
MAKNKNVKLMKIVYLAKRRSYLDKRKISTVVFVFLN